MLLEAGVSVSQLAAGATLVLHVTGQTQLPVPVNITVCGVRPGAVPCTALKEREPADGCEMAQGGCITRLMVTVCGLPGAI
jgi:hypothetical protein